MRRMFELPAYPLTEFYEPWEPLYEVGRAVVDQAFLFCERCSHGKLETLVPPALLYGSGYRTRTAASAGASKAVLNFAEFVISHCSMDAINTVLDIGANDESLLRCFRGKKTVPVDPNAESGIRAFIEDADLSPFKGDRKLILSSHTIEHLEHPAVMLEKIASILCYGDTVALQFPSLEMLVADARLDQIHHQHVHYFSERSITALMGRFCMEVVATRFDPSHYGALMVVARRGRDEVSGKQIHAIEVEVAHAQFTHGLPHGLPRGSVGFGAALMVPVLAWWFTDLHGIEFIADNDRSKDGLRYVNFNKRIHADYELAGRDVVITGIASKSAGRALVSEAFQKGARNVIVPLHAL